MDLVVRCSTSEMPRRSHSPFAGHHSLIITAAIHECTAANPLLFHRDLYDDSVLVHSTLSPCPSRCPASSPTALSTASSIDENPEDAPSLELGGGDDDVRAVPPTPPPPEDIDVRCQHHITPQRGIRELPDRASSRRIRAAGNGLGRPGDLDGRSTFSIPVRRSARGVFELPNLPAKLHLYNPGLCQAGQARYLFISRPYCFTGTRYQ